MASGGGPTTPAGRETALANLQPETAPIRHGVFMRAGIAMLCDRCPMAQFCEQHAEGGDCRRELDYIDARRKQLFARAEVDPELDAPMVAELVWAEVRLDRAMRYLAIAGEVQGLEGGWPEPCPLSDRVGRLSTQCLQLRQALGLTPAQRGKGADAQAGRGLLAALLADEIKQARGERTEPIEGEFEPENEAGGPDAGDGDGTPREAQ